ncbi:MAG: transketolase [Lachnospiraceae bacterium]|nr:transketolase [Lachnospiraceae bacterium]MCI9356019.1 transketolase [Lachnospiraceae bacterium]
MADRQIVKELEEKAYQMRVNLITLCGTFEGSVHIGGDLSMTDMMIAWYHYGLHVDPKDIQMPSRDRFVLSKGHGAVGMYIAMALKGFFDFDEILKTYGKLGSAYGMHPCKVNLPGVETSSGSLGHGLPIACGMAYWAKVQEQKHRVVVLLGDGESQEGSNWEAALAAHQYKLGNLVAVVDRNRLQLDDFTENMMSMEPYADKWKAFGWNVVEVDGHDMGALVDAIDNLPPVSSDVPTVMIGNTVKGKGVSFMENNPDWHAGSVSPEDMKKAIDEIEEEYTKRREGEWA